MAVKHDFVSAVSDGADATLVRPSNWNADHTVEDNTLAAAKLSASATDVVFGRSTAGAGAGEEIAVTPAARTVLDDTTVAAMVDTLGSASSTGTGGLVRATSPTLVTPALGTPASGTLTNCTGLPVAGGGTGGTTIATARANLQAGWLFTITASATGALNPIDATTFYNGALGPTMVEGINKIRVPRDGTIKKAYLLIVVTGTLGTTETTTFSLRLNGTTDTTITSAATHNAINNEFSNTSLSIAVVADDYFEIKFVTPTWVTNPTGVYYAMQIYME